MKKDLVRDFIGIIGGLFFILPFIFQQLKDKRAILFIVGLIALGYYTKKYIAEEVISKIESVEKQLNSSKFNINNKMSEQDKEI